MRGCRGASAGRVSTHVPARGGHGKFFQNVRLLAMFQHTCPREAGTRAIFAPDIGHKVSTHAPARGGHRRLLPCKSTGQRFNTRARARRAPHRSRLAIITSQFQHTCPREAGTYGRSRCTTNTPFQHTCPREAGTKGGGLLGLAIIVSTHVPARGGHKD